MSKSLFARFQALRTQIEGSAPAPALILITSAKRDDGTTITAARLADSLAAAGHRVALLGSTLQNAARHGEQPRISTFSLSRELAAGGRASDAVAALADKMRQEFDYTVIDAPPVMESSVSMLLANTAEAVLLAIRLGRSACFEDESMMKALEFAEARVLGVIGVSEASIREQDRTARLGAAADERGTGVQKPGESASLIATIS